VLKTQRRVLGVLDEDTLYSLRRLAEMARAEGDPERAESLVREVLAGYRRTLGDDDPETLETIEILIDLLHKRGAQDEAAALGLELKKSMQHSPGAVK
jgi:hypothetical protein